MGENRFLAATCVKPRPVVADEQIELLRVPGERDHWSRLYREHTRCGKPTGNVTSVAGAGYHQFNARPPG